MRASEYYARGIYSFFVGYGLDAVERRHGTAEVAEETEAEPAPGRVSAEDEDFDYDDVLPERCFCAATAYPPCFYCEHGDDEGDG